MTRKNLAHFYGLFAVLAVALVQVFFSLWQGGFFVEQLSWGVTAIAVVLVGAILVPGYFSSPSVGRKQWALVGALLLLTAVVTASILWSIQPFLSVLEASRTAMYVGAFVLLLPAAARWRSLIVDATVFGALLPPALYGLLQKILPTYVEYTGIARIEEARRLEFDPRASSTVGYHGTFGMMCAMGALLVIARVGSFRSFRSVPLRALYSPMGVLFLVALYFSFSRGGLVAFAAGAVVLLFLAKHRFEVLGNMAIIALPALWVVSQAQDYPGLVARPMSLEIIRADGLSLTGPLLKGLLLAFAAQVLFALLVRAVEKFVPEGVRRGTRIVGTMVVIGVVAGGLFLGWNALQQAGGFDELRSQVMVVGDIGPGEEAPAVRDQTDHFTSLSSSGRIQQWEIAWENWREHPLTGTGGDTYQVIYEEQVPEGPQRRVLYPHSIWMSLLSDTGVFAFLAFAAFCVGFLALVCYNAFYGTSGRRSRALLAGCAAAATAYLASTSIDWNWYIPASTLPFFALAAVAVVTYDPGRDTQKLTLPLEER